MIITSLLIIIVYTSLNKTNTLIINRISLLTIIISLIIYILNNDINTNKINIYNNLFMIDTKSIPFIIIIYIIFISTIIIKTYKTDLNNKYMSIILIFTLISIKLIIISNNLIIFYILIEIQSYTMYILTTMHNKSYNSTKAGLIYYIFGSFASAILLLSIYYIYYNYGTLFINDIILLNEFNTLNYPFMLFIFSLFFKMGIVPLHSWSISVYNYIPTYLTMFISIIIKLSLLAWLFINSLLFINLYSFIFIFILLSLIVSCYIPLFSINIKTILAYSGILNISYILFSILNYDISIYIYIIQYVLTHILIFIIIILIAYYNIDNHISEYSPILYIHQLKIPNKTILIIFILMLFSLIGIPPLSGFYGKFYIIISLLQDNLIIEVILLIIASIISTYYYSNIIKYLIINFNTFNNHYFIINSTLSYFISVIFIFLICYNYILIYILEGLYLILI